MIPRYLYLLGAATAQEVEQVFTNRRVGSLIPLAAHSSILGQDTEPQIAPDWLFHLCAGEWYSIEILLGAWVRMPVFSTDRLHLGGLRTYIYINGCSNILRDAFQHFMFSLSKPV